MSARRSRLAALRAFSAANGASARRDTTLFAGIFLLPLAITALVGLAMQGYTSASLSIGVLDHARSPASVELLRAIEGDPIMRTRLYDEREPMRLAVFRGRLAGGVEIAADWTPERDVDLLFSTAYSGAPAVRALVESKVRGLAAPRAAAVEIAVPGGGELSTLPIGFQYTAPSNVVLFVFIMALVGSASMVELRRSGAARRVLASPASTGELYAAFAVGPFQVMVVQCAFLIAVTAIFFGVSWGDPLGVLVVTAGLIAVGVALYVFAGTFFRTGEQAGSIGPLLGIVLGMIGGCMWPLDVTPSAVAAFGHLFPTAWAMDGYLELIFASASALEVLPIAGALFVIAFALGGTGFWRLRRQLSR